MRQERLPDDTNEFVVVNKLYDELDNVELLDRKNQSSSGDFGAVERVKDSVKPRRNSKSTTKSPVTKGSKETTESLDFQECENMMYRKHEARIFFQDRGHFWTKSRRITVAKWGYVIIVAILVGMVGTFITTLIDALLSWKFSTATEKIDKEDWAAAFFAYQFMNIFFVSISAAFCYVQPLAIGGGIPEIKAFLNGVNLSQFINMRLIVAKVLGICFSISAGLPLGKKGPLIQIGSIIGAVVSQGKNKAFGLDISFTKFESFRNDHTKRDFVTYGTAAGVAAGFRSPIGGVLFALEEGASFWSSTLTFRTFVCSMMTMLTVSMLMESHGFGYERTGEMFVFGQFKDLRDGKTNFRSYELFIFIAMGISGGALGALFNEINRRTAAFYSTHWTTKELKVVRVLLFTVVMSCISFILPLCWQKCTRLPTDEETSDWSSDELNLLDGLVRFQCKEGHYNELASLYFVTSNQGIKQLFHFREYGDSTHPSFTAGALILFFLSYFFMAAVTGGLAVPMGLFVPSLLSGAAYGRLWGHILNKAFPGTFADSGTYALMGAAAVNGGVTRITLAMTIIMLETAGNMTYLLPLMLTFGAARYSGKIFGEGIYDIQLTAKKFPFLDSALHSLGLLNFNPVTDIMATPVITLGEVDKVKRIYEVLKHTTHNGFPTIDRYGRFRGLIMRKTLCVLLELKAFSHKMSANELQHAHGMSLEEDEEGGVQLSTAAVVFYETLEKKYPKYPTISNIKLGPEDMDLYIDLRPYMDTSAFIIHSSASVARAHYQLRTLGLRHLVVIDSNHHAVGMVTRKDMTDSALRSKWEAQGEHMEKYVNMEHLPPAVVFEDDVAAVDMSTFGRGNLIHESGSDSSDDIVLSSPAGLGMRSSLSTPHSMKGTAPLDGQGHSTLPIPKALGIMFPDDDENEGEEDDIDDYAPGIVDEEIGDGNDASDELY